jgi:hypothetical protein
MFVCDLIMECLIFLTPRSVLGSLIIVMVAIFAAVSAHLLVKLSSICSAPSYKDIAIDAYGVIGAKTVELVIVLFTWVFCEYFAVCACACVKVTLFLQGAMAAYLVIMGDFLSPILNLMIHGFGPGDLCHLSTVTCVLDCKWYFDDRFLIAIWMCVICLPLGLMKKMSMLKVGIRIFFVLL